MGVKSSLFIIFILLCFITEVNGYEIKGDRSIDANCLNYSKEVVKELKKEGFINVTIVGFWTKYRLGHCMVILEPKTPNYVVIESYTGQEFTINDNLEEYLKDLIGYYPETVWIKE